MVFYQGHSNTQLQLSNTSCLNTDINTPGEQKTQGLPSKVTKALLTQFGWTAALGRVLVVLSFLNDGRHCAP